MRRLPVLWTMAALACGVALGAPGPSPAGHEDHVRAGHDVERWARIFDDPQRYKWQKPVEIFRIAGLRPGDVVADIGAGTGYFTVLLQSVVGGEGRVYAVDIDPRMLDYIEQRDKWEPFDNIVTVLAEPGDPKLPAGGVDVVLIVNTWHHIGDRPAYVRQLGRALTPGGRVVVVDWHKRELPMGPPPEEKLTREQILADFEQGGMRLTTESFVLPYQALLIFAP